MTWSVLRAGRRLAALGVVFALWLLIASPGFAQTTGSKPPATNSGTGTTTPPTTGTGSGSGTGTGSSSNGAAGSYRVKMETASSFRFPSARARWTSSGC